MKHNLVNRIKELEKKVSEMRSQVADLYIRGHNDGVVDQAREEIMFLRFLLKQL